jgi:hypothetical protein
VLELVRDLAITAIPSVRHARDATLNAIETFAEVVIEITGAPVFVDASKDAFRLKYIRHLPGFEVRVIRLIRDGRGVMNSTMRHESCSAATAARTWRDDNLELERVQRLFPRDHWLTVHYEELCTTPIETMQRVLEFLSLDLAEWSHDFRSVEHHILGNGMRLRDSSSIELDTRWQRELGPQDLAEFERIAGPLNHQYGY